MLVFEVSNNPVKIDGVVGSGDDGDRDPGITLGWLGGKLNNTAQV
jgi:hypothetical protein